MWRPWRVVYCVSVLIAAPAGTGGAWTGGAWAGSGPEFSTSGPDAAAYGAAAGYPVGARATPPVPQINMVGHYSHFAEKYPSRVAAAEIVPSVWSRAGEELTIT